MVLVLDWTVSSRALALRKRVLQMGFPCAVSFPPFAIEYLHPITCVLTFQDVVTLVLRRDWQDIPILALGKGAGMRTQQVYTVESEERLFSQMEKIFCYKRNWQKCRFSCGKGYFLEHGFIFYEKKLHFQIYPLFLTERERNILMTILTSAGTPNSYRRIEAYSFPYPYHENEMAVAETIATHISQINRKMMARCCKKCIRYDHRGTGGYILHIHDPGNR